MRNPASATFHLGETLALNAGSVLCLSATPINNSNTDLHSLLRLTDQSFFESRGLFEELLEANRPTVQAGNALYRTPVDINLLGSSVKRMAASRFIAQSPLFKKFKEKAEDLDPNDKTQLAKCQDLVEKLNLLGGYLNRTRRVQVPTGANGFLRRSSIPSRLASSKVCATLCAVSAPESKEMPPVAPRAWQQGERPGGRGQGS